MKSFKVCFLATEYDLYYITDASQIGSPLTDTIDTRDLIGLDIETMAKSQYKHIEEAALSPHTSDIRLIQIFYDGIVYVFDCLKIGLEKSVEILSEFLSKSRFIAHNAMFELSFFSSPPWNIKDMNVGCTMHLARIINHATSPDDLLASLKSVVWNLFRTDLVKEVQASDWGVEDLNYEQIAYAGIDALATYLIAEKLAPRLAELGLTDTYKLIKAAQAPLVAMQLNGMRINEEKHAVLIEKWKHDLFEAREKVLTLTGLDTITSHKLAKWLEKTLTEVQLNDWPRTPKNKLKTDANTFSQFSHLEIVKPYTEFQKLDKLASVYGASLRNMKNEATGKLHCSYNLSGTRTGRLSCSKPNLQNLPRDKVIRDIFVPDEGKVFIVADYSQIELRVAAELSRDPVFLYAYNNGLDIHSVTAGQIFQVPAEQVTEEQRQLGKTANFGLVYGQGVASFTKYANKNTKANHSEEFYQGIVYPYRKTYSKYFEWYQEVYEEALRTCTIRTVGGKLRKMEEDWCYSQAPNHLIQGASAEIMLQALVLLNQRLNESGKLINTVHDEIILEVCDNKMSIQAGADFIEECMVIAFQTYFPNGIINGLVNVSSGDSWATAK